MNKKIIGLLLTISTIISVTACQGKSVAGEAYEKHGEYVDFSEEPVTITLLTIGDKPTNGQTEEAIKELNKILRKNLNARLDIYYVGWNDFLNNYNLTLDNPETGIDIVATSTDWLDAWPNVIKGNFMPLSEDELKTYCPETYSHVSESQWSKCTYDGEIYLIPENEYTQWTNHGFIYRQDYAFEAGLDGIHSWEDLDKYFECVTDRHEELIAWDADGSNVIPVLGYLMSKKNYLPIYELGSYGLWGAYSDDPGAVVSPYYEGDELVEYARLMKKWNDMGVWRLNLEEAGDNTSEFYEGVTTVVQHHTQNYYTEVSPKMNISQPEVRTGFYWFGEENSNLMRTSILHGAVAISAHSQNPERALMVYDMLRNDETCNRLIRYGLEGRQYAISKEGMLEKPSGYNADRDGIVTNFWWGRRDELDIPDASYAWRDYRELTDVYETVAADYPWESVPFSTQGVNSRLERINEVCDEYLYEIAYGKYDGTPEKEVAMFRRELKAAGFEEVTKLLQDILNSQ